MDQRRRRRHSSEEGGARLCGHAGCDFSAKVYVWLMFSYGFIMCHDLYDLSCSIMFIPFWMTIPTHHDSDVGSVQDVSAISPRTMCQAPGRRERHVSISLSPHRFGHKGCVFELLLLCKVQPHNMKITVNVYCRLHWNSNILKKPRSSRVSVDDLQHMHAKVSF